MPQKREFLARVDRPISAARGGSGANEGGDSAKVSAGAPSARRALDSIYFEEAASRRHY